MYPGSDTAEGVPLIKVSDIKNGEVQGKPSFCISREVDEEYKRTRLRGDELLITLVGEPGDCAIATDEMAGWNAARAVAVVKLKNPDLRPWLRFVLLSAPAKHLIGARLNTTVQKTLNLKDIRELGVPLPPEICRNQVVGVLSSLDRKISLNRRINQTLEAMAQAIFKSWFVDFDPVKAKIAAIEQGQDPLRAAMRAISGKTDFELDQMPRAHHDQLAAIAARLPDAMEESELGEIPKGWEVSDFGSVSVCFDKNRIPLSKRQRENKKGNIPYYGATSVMDYVDEHIFDDIYLLLGEDGSVLKPDGSPFVQYIWGKSWVNNHAHVLQGANGVSTEQLMIFISMQNISAYVTGAVQLKLNQKNMNSIPFVKADDEVNRRFSEIIAPFFAQYRLLVEEVRGLALLRDTLLPKLLSGELSVAPLEKQGALP